MRIQNCTNKETAVLKQHGLLDQGIEVNGAVLMPGASAEVPDTDKEHFDRVHAHLLATGALKWEEPKPAPVEVEIEAAPETSPGPVAEEVPNALVDLTKGKNRSR